MIEAGNAAVSGMSAAEAAAALGVVESGKMVSFTVIEGGAGPVIELTGATASEAFAAYEAAGGAVSAAGAATEGASVAANLTEIITAPGTASEAVATGGILSLSLPTWVAAAAPLLGVAIGAGLYELSPEFWEKVSRTLLPFCWEGTEVMPAVVDANNQVYIEGAALDALHQLFVDEGIGQEFEPSSPATGNLTVTSIGNLETALSYAFSYSSLNVSFNDAAWTALQNFISSHQGYSFYIEWQITHTYTDWSNGVLWIFAENLSIGSTYSFTSSASSTKYNLEAITFRGNRSSSTPNNVILSNPNLYTMPSPRYVGAEARGNTLYVSTVNGTEIDNYPDGTSKWNGNEIPDYSRGGATVVTNPDGNGDSYYPVQLPIEVPDPGVSNDPDENPNPTAPTPDPAVSPHIDPTPKPNQYPVEIPAPGPGKGTAPLPNPVTIPEPIFDPDDDPSGDPDPDPAPDPPPPPPPPKPKGVTPTPILPQNIPSIVPSTDASGLIHVYNPTPAEMISFGRWLWVTYADATIDKIWNNPFDGILGAFELYATPSTGAKENIRSGFLVSDTQAAIVPTRYISIDCGSIVIPEELSNYLDYSPYSKAYVYLPFIGIVELDVDDIVGHGINILYHIDTYNGSCIAQITVARDDYSNTVYQFSGNCAVDVPLSGGSQAAIKAGMIGAAATGIASVIGGVATGLSGNIPGAVGGVAYGLGGAVAHAVSQKSSVQHSGTFGASYGAMGIKTPYIIIKRPVQVGVVNYNVDYGFPAHKRVIIGNCTGFLRVREVNVISPNATDDEKKRIEELLKEGVYIG